MVSYESFLYSEYVDSYVSLAGFQLARLCTQLHYQPADVFVNDWLCMSKKEILLEQLGSEQYYSSSIYPSHLWVENVAARRIFFVRQIQALANSMGLGLSESRILDVGSGMGGTLRLFTDAQERIGIDISEPMMHWCNEVRKAKDMRLWIAGAWTFPRTGSILFYVSTFWSIFRNLDSPCWRWPV